MGLKTKSYGVADCRYMVISKKQTSEEIFKELINSDTYENEYYILLPPNSVNKDTSVSLL